MIRRARQTLLRLSSAQNADIAVEILEQPLVRLDERKVSVMLGTTLTPLLPRLLNRMNLLPVPQQLSQLTLFHFRAFADGAAGDSLTVEVDMLR